MSDLFVAYDPAASGGPAPDGLTVRRALLRDVPGIAAILAARNGWDEGETAKRTEHGVSQPDDAGFYGVAASGGMVVGYARAARYAPPDDAPANAAPAGWYLLGLAVAPELRRRGIARALTAWRLARIAERAEEVFYFASASNRASIDLHAALGFEEVTRDFWFPAVDFAHGDGALYRLGALEPYRRGR
jgi:ribosomal protein S18 acetylase RimI-like enzyme